MPLMIYEKETKLFFFYGSLDPLLLDDYPTLRAGTVNNSISRLKIPYEDENYIIYKGALKRAKFKKKVINK